MSSSLHRHFVRATVRSEEKKAAILAQYPDAVSNGQLEVVIVEDIGAPGAHDAALVADPPLDAIVHTASPFHMNVKDTIKDMLEPAIEGTKGILRSAKALAPSVKRVVITSSFASILDPSKGSWPGKVYTEEDWNPITWETAVDDLGQVYRGSKKFAEKAAWDFVEQEKPNFDVVTICPPMVFGPVINAQKLSSLNTSNLRVWEYLSGQNKEVKPSGVHLWVDVRDLGVAHVRALDRDIVPSDRYFVLADGIYSNQDICDILRKHFPDVRDRVPEGTPGASLGLKPGEYFLGDNSKSKKILGLKYRSLEDSLVDLTQSLLEMEKQESSA